MKKFFKKTIQYTLILGGIYSVLVLSFVWWHCYTSPLQGGKNGPLDAYRHTLASAVVAYTASPKLVAVITIIMERKGTAANLMDSHNNTIGAKIGSNTNTFSVLNQTVTAQVAHGAVNTPLSNQITWLPNLYWHNNFWW